MNSKYSYQSLIAQLDAFIRKYYKNQLLKGAMLCLAAGISLLITLSFIEYLGQFEKLGRTILFYLFIGFVCFVLSKWVILPLLKLYRLGDSISREDAAIIVGEHFPEINDKILNTLQLHESSDGSENDLVLASIAQKTKEMSSFSFLSVVDYSENKRYLRFLIPPLIVLVGVLFINAKIITESSKRIVLHGKHFAPIAPFDFILKNGSLTSLSDNDFTVEVETKGQTTPKELFIVLEDESYRLSGSNGVFKHTFKSVQNDINFYFTDKEFNSKEYRLVVNQKPSFSDMTLSLDFPKYTKKKSVESKNTGNAIIPEGSKVTWSVRTKNSSESSFGFSDTVYSFDKSSIALSKQFFESENYFLIIKNAFAGADSSIFSISVIKDEFPKITLNEDLDSLDNNIHYFSGKVNDDYGFNSLRFIYQNKTSGEKAISTSLPISNQFNEDLYYHMWDISELNLTPGDELVYYFEVFDNDGVNGSKSTRSAIKTFKAPTLEELENQAEKSNESIKNNMDKSLSDAQNLREELKRIQENMLNKKTLDYQDKQQISDFLQQQKQLEKQLEELKNESSQKNKQQTDFKQLDENILKKQEQLQKLFDELMSDELKELYKELENLMEELNKDKIQDAIDELNFEQEDIEEQLDRSLELFKQLEFDEKLNSISEKLEELSKDQQQLSEETKEKKLSNQELKKKQNDIDDRFKQVKDDLEQLNKLNEELENKHNMDDTKEDESAIQNEINDSKEQLEKNNSKKASGSQQNASDKMQQLQQKMEQMQSQQQQQQQEEDMSALRMLLENLVAFSFEQEDVLESFSSLSTSDPKYTDLSRQQRKLVDDAELIKDSLHALSKRVYQIESFVTKEINDINENLSKSVDLLSERKTSQARVKQQNIMTSSNNLALLLDEILQQMQQQAASKMPGTGNCQKPGGAGASSPSMQDLQNQLSEQLKKMKQQMKNKGGKQDGGKDGKGKKGESGKTPGGSQGSFGMGGQMSKELAKMAAQQEAIRKEIQRLAQELNKDGSGSGNGLKKLAKELEKNEEDLVNKRLNENLIKRQEDIITRLLEHDKAQREQEFDNKRESEDVKNQKFGNPTQYLEYKRRKEKEIELLKTIPLDLNEYYKNKVNEYFNLLE